MLHRLHRWWAVLIIAGLVICAVLLLHTLWWQDPQQVAAFDTSDAIHAVAISDDQSLIAAGDTAGQITIWQLDTRQIVQQWQHAAGHRFVQACRFWIYDFGLTIATWILDLRFWIDDFGYRAW